MIWILLTIGMLAKTILMSVFNYQKRDRIFIPMALLAGLMSAGELADGSIKEYVDPWVGFPVGFAFVIAFAFKDRLLPTITEGTLFGYALVAGYLLSVMVEKILILSACQSWR